MHAVKSPQESSPTGVELVTHDYTVGVWRNVLVVDWRERTTGDGARDVHFRLQRLARTYPDGVFYLAFVSEHAAPPDFDARQTLANMLKAGRSILAGAVVFDGAGLRGAFVRGVATGLVMLARPSFPFVVCSLDDAGRLFADMASAHGSSFDAKHFIPEAKALRAAMVAHPESSKRIITH
jgi:hypothetical protein